jgi:hypothetical protein
MQRASWRPLQLHPDGNSILNSSSGTGADQTALMLPPITVQQEQATRHWLHELGLCLLDHNSSSSTNTIITSITSTSSTATSSSSSSSSSSGSIVQNALRNGCLLCAVLFIVDPVAAGASHLVQLTHWRPLSVHDCHANLKRALWLLRIKHCPPLPAVYAADPALHLRGCRSAVWGLLWHMSQHFAAPTTCVGGSVSGSSSGSAGSGSEAVVSKALHALAPVLRGGDCGVVLCSHYTLAQVTAVVIVKTLL